MAVAHDLTGLNVGYLTVLHRAVGIPGKPSWICRCDCGALTRVRAAALKGAHTKSCGCSTLALNRAAHQTHGLSTTREFRAWTSAKTRCFNPKAHNYPLYGGRGITMCDEWRTNFPRFLADMGLCPEGYSLDRHPDQSGPYAPGNCRWATSGQQANNLRTNRILEFGERRLTLEQWRRRLGFKKNVLAMRLRAGWSVERALTEPVRHRSNL